MNKYNFFNKKIFTKLCVIALSFFVFATTTFSSGVPTILSFQGRLADSSGNLLGGSGTTYYFKFSIWDDTTVGSGSRLWPTAVPSVSSSTVRQGVFNVDIGDIASGYPDVLNYDFNTNDSIYLQIEVATTSGGTYQTLSPRKKITSSPFSQLAGAVSGVGQSAFGTTTPISSSVVSVISTSTSSTALTIRSFLAQVANLLQIQDSTGANIFAINANGSLSASGTILASNFSGTSTGVNTGDESSSTIRTKIGVASSTNDGYLSATDWNTFNNKVSGTGATNTLAYWTNASTVATLPNGIVGQFLTASSTSPTGFEWAFASSSSATVAWGAITGLVSDQLDLQAVFDTKLSTTSAAATYLTIANATSTYVPYSYASTTFPTFTYGSSTYATIANYPTYTYASSTYASTTYVTSTFLTQANASSTYAKLAGAVFTGTISAVNFSGTSTGVNTGDVTLVNNANGLTISGQALTMALSGTTATGTLSALDWNTFNNKVSGSGVGGKTAFWTSASTLSSGTMFDNGLVQGINATSSTVNFNIQGTAGAYDPFRVASSTGTATFIVKQSGNVGIGTSTPDSTLSIAGAETTGKIVSIYGGSLTTGSALSINANNGSNAISFETGTTTLKLSTTDNTGTFNIVDASGNKLLEIKDYATAIQSVVSAGAFIDHLSYMGQEFNADINIAASVGLAGDDLSWAAKRGGGGGSSGFLNPRTVNGVGRLSHDTTNARGASITYGTVTTNGGAVNTIFSKSNLPIVQMKFIPVQSGGALVTTADYVIGLIDGPTTPPVVDDTLPTNGIFFSTNNSTSTTGSSLTLLGVVRSGGANVGTVSCTGTYTFGDSITARIQVESATLVRFLMDFNATDGISWTDCGTVSGANPTAAMTAGAYGIYNDTTARQFDIDYIRIWQDDPETTETSATEITQTLPPSFDAKSVLADLMEAKAIKDPLSGAREFPVDRLIANLEIVTPKITASELVLDSIFSLNSLISFMSDTFFSGRTYFNTDTAGFAKITQGQKSVDIIFDREYAEQPIVNASISLDDSDNVATVGNSIFNNDIRYVIMKKSTKGFTILLNKETMEDVTFSWNAFAVKNAKTFDSVIDEIITASNTTPPVDTTAPASDTETAPADTTAPASDTETAPADTTAPASDTETAPADTTAPASDTETAPADTTAPASDTETAPADTTAPASDTETAPADTTAPGAVI